jgi:hypothetical protein
MATLMRDILAMQGTHSISTINSKWAKPLVNGAVLEENIDNGLLVSLDGRDSETGLFKCKAYTGTGDAYIIQSVEEEQLMTDMGEYDYKCFYNAKDEIVRLFKAVADLRQETSAYVLDTGVTLARDLPVIYDFANKHFKVVSTIGAGQTQIATVADIDTDFGYNAGVSTIRIQYV